MQSWIQESKKLFVKNLEYFLNVQKEVLEGMIVFQNDKSQLIDRFIFFEENKETVNSLNHMKTNKQAKNA